MYPKPFYLLEADYMVRKVNENKEELRHVSFKRSAQ